MRKIQVNDSVRNPNLFDKKNKVGIVKEIVVSSTSVERAIVEYPTYTAKPFRLTSLIQLKGEKK